MTPTSLKPLAPICALLFVMAGGAWNLTAQAPFKRYVDVTVTDPKGRTVTGLDEKHFTVVEAGVQRVITEFSDAGSPIALAIVSSESLADLGALGPEDELIQTASLSNAVRQLAASKNSRKVIFVFSALDSNAIPDGIQALQVSRADMVKALIKVRHQYRIQFESSTPSARAEVVLQPPTGLPPLELNWK